MIPQNRGREGRVGDERITRLGAFVGIFQTRVAALAAPISGPGCRLEDEGLQLRACPIPHSFVPRSLCAIGSADNNLSESQRLTNNSPAGLSMPSVKAKYASRVGTGPSVRAQTVW